MLSDRHRTLAYKAAIENAKAFIQNKVSLYLFVRLVKNLLLLADPGVVTANLHIMYVTMYVILNFGLYKQPCI